MADFTARGIDAVNFGPGATRYAHRRDELVEIDALVSRLRDAAPLPRPADVSDAGLPDSPRPGDVSVRPPQPGGGRARADGLEVIDFGMGDPREPTDPRIIAGARDGVRERMGYPAAVGLPELREAVAGWVGRRFGVSLDPDAHVIPTLGSKEAIFSFAHVVLDLAGGRDTVVVTEPGYPVRERGAQFAGARVVELPLLEANGFLPDLDAVPRDLAGGRRSSGSTTRTTRRCDGAARVLRAARGARPRARFRARLRRGVHASCGSTSRRSRRSSSPTGRTSSRSTRSPSARR